MPYEMRIKLLAFSHAADLVGSRDQDVEYDPAETPRSFISRIAPQLVHEGFRVAVDLEYHSWDQPIGEAAELAIIPPVSGG